ncbi:hypothetical protein ACF1BQ_016630 [Bradyrhizobium sp. RDT10]
MCTNERDNRAPQSPSRFHDHALWLRAQFRPSRRKPVRDQGRDLVADVETPVRKGADELFEGAEGQDPYIEDDGQLLGDSTLIRWHLEKKYGIDFDQGLTAEQLAIAWAFEKMAEDNLYWASVYFRWMIDDNFRKDRSISSRACLRRSGPLSPR